MQAIIPFAYKTCYNRRTASTCEHISMRSWPVGAIWPNDETPVIAS